MKLKITLLKYVLFNHKNVQIFFWIIIYFKDLIINKTVTKIKVYRNWLNIDLQHKD